ncbi:non-ribosomal peptide synthetase [Desulfosporosinus shakirovi]|uniref:non-ribosomal peptide synthetase n=1 Tax=Desulfosporosinus shakirovi TaxID=2885154 RepID=UPI001E405E47|nr:non-ribosomal peptide synthetase [Desulfosporosinus sp. SRJS8]MCB8816725.1 amino acid adenylation domain-containing protein [Desulfosporosinus sp. SRJS8]
MKSENNAPFPLTDVQWAYLMGRNEAYRSGGIAPHVYYEFRNSMDIPRLEEAVNKVIARHPMLHTVVSPQGEQKTIEIPDYYKIKTYDLKNLSVQGQEEHILKRRAVLSHQVYDPVVWPMFTIETARLSETRRYLFISLDMLIADAGSLTLMFQEILEYYRNPELEKPLPPVSFREHVLYMQNIKKSKKYREDRAYWQGKVKDLPPAPVLPGKALQAGRVKFKRLKHCFPREVWTKVKEELARERILTSVFLCTCYGEVLSYWSGESDFSLNLTLSHRGKLRGCRNVIGDFTSLMLVPLHLESRKENFWRKAQAVQESFLEAYSHGAYDGIEVIRDVMKYRSAQNQALFPIVFTSLIAGSTEDVSASLLGELGEMRYSLSQTPQVYLDCQVHEEGAGLVVTWDYLEEKFDGGMLANMFGQFTALIELAGKGIGEDYRKPFKAGPEILDLVKHYNQTTQTFPETTLQKIVEDSFQKYSNRPALKDGEREWTYAEVDEHGEKYAQSLRCRGIGPGDFVGVKGSREAETIFKIIGIIKCGAAYVPINPDYPALRVEYILTNCRCKAYLAEEGKGAARVGEGKSRPSESVLGESVLPEGLLRDCLLQESMTPEGLSREAQGRDSAYVIHTSGSTGKPKGVLISHEAVCNTLYDINQRFAVGEEDRILNVSSFGFDLSVYDIFGSILAGACLILAREPRDIHELKELILQEKITLWNSVPAILDLVIDSLGADRSYDLRTVMLSGDWIPLSLPAKVRQKFPEARLFSLGGATEAAIWSIYYEVRETDKDWASIPYGYPLANQSCYVLNPELELCPEEVAGEIYIGGKGVADGYINNQELTEKSFLQPETWGRIYKTGDWGIFRKEGYIDILGRLDQQVKINGYRVEKGEIEKVLEESPYIKTAFVDIKTGQGQRLVAYLVPPKREIPAQPSDALLEAGRKASAQIPPELQNEIFLELGKDMEQLALESLKSTLGEFLANHGLRETLSLEDFLEQSGIKEVYQKLVFGWLEDLVRDGHLIKKETGYDFTALRAKSKKEIQTEFLKLKEKYGNLPFISEKGSNTLSFYEQCMLYGKDILTGEKATLDFLFPKGSWAIARELYQESPSARYFNHIVGELVLNYIARQAAGSKISLLELGAGTGGTSKSLLETVQGYVREYVFTDLSNFFLKQASELFKGYDFIKYGIYDLDVSPQEQGYPLESYDIVLAANALHDAKDVAETLKHSYDLLKPGGLVLLIEITRESYLQRTTFELLEGFSGYTDFRLDTHSALLPERVWSRLLRESGFTTTAFFPRDDCEEAPLGEHVILGVKEGISRFLSQEELAEVREETSSKLASYMMPKEYIQLREIPLNQNGKVDQARLPKPRRTKDSSDFVKPSRGMEKAIFKIWSDLLGSTEFGIEDDFFMIGGDSLLMIKFQTKIEAIYSCKIEINDFLEKSTIKRMADLLTNLGAVAEEDR